METINMTNLTEQMNSKKELEETLENYDDYLQAQETICKSRLLPRNLQGQKDTLEQLGFKFYDYSPIKGMYSTIMPEGWSLVPTQNVLWTNIVDDNNLIRGLIYYNPIKGKSAVTLKNRYGIHTETTKTNTPKGLVVEKRVYFGEEGNMLHIAGYVGANMNEENAEEILKQVELFESVAKAYADKHYPNWEDVTLYWGTPKSKQYTR